VVQLKLVKNVTEIVTVLIMLCVEKNSDVKRDFAPAKVVMSKKADACEKATIKAFDEACDATNICGEHMTCTGGKCACGASYKEDNKKCISALTQKLDEACDNAAKKMCVAGLICAGTKKCACSKADYTFSTSSSTCMGLLNDKTCAATGKGKICHAEYNLECKTAKCTCKTDYNWGAYVDGLGAESNQCVHKDAAKDKGEGDECKAVTDNTGKLCKKGYRCDSCPEDSTNKCYKQPEETTTGKGHASTIVINSFLVFSAAALKMFF